MAEERRNCHVCGSELTPSNSFKCKRCGREDICILHQGSISGNCSKCLALLRNRMIYPTFTAITVALLLFSPHVYENIPPILGFLFLIALPFWLMVEFARPVITFSRMKRIIANVFVIAVLIIFLFLVSMYVFTSLRFIRITPGLASTVFLLLGMVLLIMGFTYLFTGSLRGLGINLFSYDYPEEYNLLLRKAGGNPEMIGSMKWDLKWITSISFIYGLLFIYLYIRSSGLI